MYRTRGKLLGAVLAVAAAGLLTACGDDESTATATPSLTTSAAAPQATSPSAAPENSDPAQSSPAQPAPETPAEEPAPESAERPAPTQVPDAGGVQVSAKEQAFIDELGKQGITPGSPDIAISIGNYVCQSVSAGQSDAAMTTFVTAMAGSDPAFDPAKMSVEQAGQIYINVAKSTYCQ